ncbi:hypothetical protein CCACVL1_17286, partial [Corchorus capsularis]
LVQARLTGSFQVMLNWATTGASSEKNPKTQKT